MVKFGDSKLVIWVEKVKDYIRIEAVFVTCNNEPKNDIMVNNIYRIKESEEQYLFFIIYYLSDRYGIKEIIQSNYLITDERITKSYEMSASKNTYFQNEKIIDVTDIDMKNLL